ncbi:MAG: hypothetical protein ACJ780_11595 [Solirubrobacteraceae bacterium]
MGAAGVAAASAVIPGREAFARSHPDSINEWGVFCVHERALTVTITSELGAPYEQASRGPEFGVGHL